MSDAASRDPGRSGLGHVLKLSYVGRERRGRSRRARDERLYPNRASAIRPMSDPRVLAAGQEVTLAFGPRTILSNASFAIREKERAALVGPNGAGKTTIIRLLTGAVRPDMGDVAVDPSLRFGYLAQQFEFPPDATIGALLTEKPLQVRQMEAEIAAIEERLADPAFYEEPGYQDVLKHYAELQRDVAALSSKGDAQAALSMLQELGMGEAEFDWKMKSLSGGQKTRVLLAKALANYEEMDLLILDEPTNHLDIETVEWLEEFLVERYGNALLLVAHDQYLMDNLATKILEVENLKVWEWDGNFTDYREQKAAYLRALDAKRRRDYDELKRQHMIIEEIKRRNKYDAQARSKATRLEKIRRGMGDVDYSVLDQKTFKLKLAATSKSSNDVLRIEGLAKRFADGETILHGAELHVSKGDKVGLIGPNGCGKTTLLRMIVSAAAATGQAVFKTGAPIAEAPSRGVLEISPGVRVGFFDQEHAGLDPDRTLIEEIRTARPPPAPRMGDEEARGLLGRFLFKGDDAFKHVRKLSGGEKARLSLAKFLIGETNLLVLDEPTNHLDLASQDVVENALREYTGTLIVVSHDRHFLDAIVNRVAVIANRRIGTFPGTFSETRTLTRLHEFVGEGQVTEYVVRRAFKDYELNRRYSTGERVKVTGGETQTTKRLYRLAIERGWMELS